MIVDVMRKLKFDVTYILYRADRKFEQEAASHLHQFHAESELQDIKARCPKDD